MGNETRARLKIVKDYLKINKVYMYKGSFFFSGKKKESLTRYVYKSAVKQLSYSHKRTGKRKGERISNKEKSFDTQKNIKMLTVFMYHV